MLSEIGGPWILAIGAASLLGLLLVLVLRPRAGVAGRALVSLEGVVHARARRSFLLETSRGQVPVLTDGALLARRGLRPGDRVQVVGIWRDVPRAESLYRELGCEQALDAACVLRSLRFRPLLRGLALAACLGGVGFFGLLGLSRLGEELEVPIPVEALTPTRALLRGSLGCPDGARALLRPVRDPAGPGWLRWCALPDGRAHGPSLEHDLLGRVRTEGEHRLGDRHGRWTIRSSRDPFLRVLHYDRGELHGRYLEEGFGTREEGEYRHGLKHGRWDRFEPGAGAARPGLVSSRRYAQGIPDGYWIEPGAQGHYRRGERDGSWSIDAEQPPELLAATYDRPLAAQISFRAGVREGPALWLDGQRVVARGSYRGGKPSGRWARLGDSRRDDGLLEEVGYRDGRRDGPSRLFTPDGALAAEGAYRQGERDGPWRFWTLGRLATGDYRAGQRVGRWTVYRVRDRRIVGAREEGQYRDGLRDGVWRELDADGEVMATRRYLRGRRLDDRAPRAGETRSSLRLPVRLLLVGGVPDLPSVELRGDR